LSPRGRNRCDCRSRRGPSSPGRPAGDTIPEHEVARHPPIGGSVATDWSSTQLPRRKIATGISGYGALREIRGGRAARPRGASPGQGLCRDPSENTPSFKTRGTGTSTSTGDPGLEVVEELEPDPRTHRPGCSDRSHPNSALALEGLRESLPASHLRLTHVRHADDSPRPFRGGCGARRLPRLSRSRRRRVARRDVQR
jgi:hypothetical protein